MNKSQLRLAANISTNAMTKLGKEESVSTEILHKFVMLLNALLTI